MAELVLFHSVLGLREGINGAAEILRNAGHIVHTPNLYGDGIVFDDYKKANEYVQSIGGYPELIKRTKAAVSTLPCKLVYAGFSNGGASAEYLAATRPEAQAALLFSSATPLRMLVELGGDMLQQAWPPDVPVQLHYMTNDGFRNQAWVDDFTNTVQASNTSFSFFEYPGDGHLFTDKSLTREYDASASSQLWGRVLQFLAELS